ncbi:MAG: transporter [Deltaproteobacteria bacterium]|nr:transporter [Deltaproteobacteria bacterium]
MGTAIVLGVAALGVSSAAHAQASPPFDPAIDIQTFSYAIGPKSFFTVSDADVADQKQLAVDALFTYLTKPFTIYNVDVNDDNRITGARSQVVESMTAAQITAAYGVSENIQLGANLPIVFKMEGQGLDPVTGGPGMTGLNVTGLGDILVEGKVRFYKNEGFRLGARVGVTVPTSFGSDDSKFLGDNLPTLRAGLALQYDVSRISFGLNGGVLFRKPREIYDTTVGQQLTWGAGLALRITDKFSVIGEGYGRKSMFDSSLDASPLEVEGGIRLYATSAVAIVVGGGAGLVKGIGSPASRFFLSIGYAPDVRDSDGDGIANGRDKCPLVAEDKDRWEDDDGCPEDDNDGDRRPDADDKCVNEAEDIDGYEDDDGCPELDNDADKIADLQDKCPNDAEDGKQPYPNDGCPANKRDSDADGVVDSADTCPTAEEDVDGFEDGDGCPEADNDNDGVADADDKCGLCTEDKDGFEDADGCPDLDNDKDGVADAKDACPNEAETLNGVKDDDGCPDAGAATVKLDGDVLQITNVPTLAGAKLSAAGTQIVDQIALLMLGHTEVTKWLVAVAQPQAANAQKLADAIKARLVAKGVSADTFTIIAATGAAKMGGAVQERGEAAAFVCPIGREVSERPEAKKAVPPAPAPAPKLPGPGEDLGLRRGPGRDLEDLDRTAVVLGEADIDPPQRAITRRGDAAWLDRVADDHAA